MKVHIAIALCLALAALSCEEVDLSTGPSGAGGITDLVRLDNRSTYDIQVSIEACFQDFTLVSNSVKTIECKPEDGSSNFTVNMVRPDFSDANWSDTVAQGQIVVILTDPWNSRFFDVEVED
ncbi:MAG: hypothetical protein O2910_01555 [Proteobacteria bacterium]|nr:hypothetical protein [Pseudomonadota bacterium]